MNCLIMMPAFNEGDSIGGVLEGLLQQSLNADILVVNDGSTDDTEAVALTFPVHVVSHPCNLGYGAALQTGFKFASLGGYSHVIQFDSDGQHNPRDVHVIMSALREGRADVVIGSRFLGDPNFNPGSTKMLALKFFRFLIWSVTKVRVSDPTSGIRGLSHRAFRYYAVKDRFPSDFPDADIAIDILLRGFTIDEVPVGNRERETGQSMHSGLKPLMYMLKVLLSTLVIVLNHRTSRGGVHHE